MFEPVTKEGVLAPKVLGDGGRFPQGLCRVCELDLERLDAFGKICEWDADDGLD